MKSLSVSCFYFIFFFQATQSIVWSIMHYIYFRFWISVIHCIESFIYFRFFFVLGLAEKLWESHHNKLLLMKIYEKIVSNSENNHHRNYEIYFLPRIITQCLSASSEAQVLTWLYVQFHETREIHLVSLLILLYLQTVMRHSA